MKAKCVWFIAISMLFSHGFAAMRDPTMPYGYHAPETVVPHQASNQVSAIIVGPKRKIAVIDDAFFQLGDQLQDDKILGISEQGVLVHDATGKTSKIHPFVEQEVKKEVKSDGKR